MVTWDIFVKLRRLQPTVWMQQRNVSSYADFVEKLKALGVSPPSPSVYEVLSAPLRKKEEPLPLSSPDAASLAEEGKVEAPAVREKEKRPKIKAKAVEAPPEEEAG